MDGYLICFFSIYLINFTYGAGGARNQDTVTYYEDLIETETQKAFHYSLPTSAEAYRPVNNDPPEEYGTYDFIIVGAGSAGSVVASRLSEISDWNILLLEAGGTETDFTDIPAMHLYLQGLRFNWNFNTTSQKTACLGMINQRCAMPRGLVLGGTSTINGLVYSRGNKRDYDGWAAEGNKGWSYKDVLPYFIKSENSHIDGDPGYHGRGGYWNVEYHRPTSKQLIAFLEANKELYNSTAVDYNGRQELGMFKSQLSNIHGRRDSTAKAFLRPAANRTNLHILTGAYVTKVLVSKNKIATGVQFARGGKLYVARAAKEVIVSGGSINSPQILMLSGIGPKKHLKKLGIPLVQNLAVGQKFQDHATFYGLYINTNIVEPVESLEEMIKGYLADYGPLSIALNSQGVGFFQSNYTNISGYPDIEFEFIPSNSTSPVLQTSLKITDETFNALSANLDSQRSFNLYLIVLHPSSMGTITLQSKDPYLYPLINPRYLSDPEGKDINTMYQGLQILEKLLQTEPMRKINASIILADYPQCKQHLIGSKDYWYCAFRLLTAHLYHPVCTCAMGTNPKNGAVVDYKLKVHGITGLRVADVSIVPFPTSGHTGAPAVMIGEKVSDQIKLDHGKPIQRISNTIW